MELMMSIGYACIAVGLTDANQKTCIAKNASEIKLNELIEHNLNALEVMVDYNIENNIKLFRISSDIIPFGSSPVNNLKWWENFEGTFQRIGGKIKSSGMRVSMHPGQYTVLNSLDVDVVNRAMVDLDYSARVLDSLELNAKHKIILHIGGIYQNKTQAVERFCENYSHLNEAVKRRLVIENDDKSYNVLDVLEIGKCMKIPVVFDNLHNAVNPYDDNHSEVYWINECKKTWMEIDGAQKIHYSQQAQAKRVGSHSSTIRINEFIKFYKQIEHDNIDIMLEVKDKNLSAIKCINCTSSERKIKTLELEWSRYKYKVLECSQEHYLMVRRLLINKADYPAIAFYNIIEDALQKDINMENSVNAAQHVWGYFKNKATEIEKRSCLKNIELLKKGETSSKSTKNILWKMTVKYEEKYLLNSYYFDL